MSTNMEGFLKHQQEEGELRRGPWTVEEDALLIHYIACHGEGRWNLLAKSSGLKRTGKSCRLRWLNYLKPDVKRGNLTPEEQILILELHSRWGNRWSRIAQHLPGRTDNEIKNYWRTRVQRQAKQLKIDANSDLFRDTIRRLWMPRLVDESSAASSRSHESATTIEPYNLSIPTSQTPPSFYGTDVAQKQPQFLQNGVTGSDTIPCSMVQLPDCGNWQFPPTTFDGYGQFLETESPIQEMDTGACDLTSDGSMSVGTDGLIRPWDSLDELWQVLTTTRK